MNSAPWQLMSVIIAGWMSRHQQQVIDYLKEENRVLREKIGKKRVRLNDDQRRRLAAKGKVLGRSHLAEVCSIVTPDTILRWHRQLIAKKYDSSGKRRPGRPRIMDRIRKLIVRMATENERWGYCRIQGALANVGHQVSRSTIRRTLKDHGIEPAPERGKRTPWKKFLKAHWGAIAAADFFTVEVWMLRGLTRIHVFFVIDLATRRVQIAGMSASPSGRWTEQMARNLTDPFDGYLRNHRCLICDRDPLYTRAFRNILGSSGVTVVRLPPRSPNLNAYAERFVRSIKSESLERMIFLGEQHLRTVIDEYMEHYHLERNHQGLENRLIAPSQTVGEPFEAVECRKRLGGMLNYYHRRAA